MYVLSDPEGRVLSRHSSKKSAIGDLVQAVLALHSTVVLTFKVSPQATEVYLNEVLTHTLQELGSVAQKQAALIQFRGPAPSIGWYNCVNDVYRKLSNLPDLSKMRHLDLAYLYVDARDNCVGIQHLTKGDLKGPGKATLEDMAKLNAARLMKLPTGAWAVLLLLKTVDNCFSNYKKKL
jgi:hypothetical protein